MGANVAAYYASEYPDKVCGLILEDPGFRLMESSKIKKKIIKFFMRLLLPIFLRGNYEKLLKRGKNQNPKWSDEELKPWAHSKLQFKEKDPKYLLGLFEDKFNWKQVVSAISCPILLLTSSDGFTKDEKAKKMMDLNLLLQWEKIKDAGHNIRREQFKEYFEVISKFLDDL
jgi:pimeloyl-ACP methyl ester carboxylesterase